jgi:hypothetical protein
MRKISLPAGVSIWSVMAVGFFLCSAVVFLSPAFDYITQGRTNTQMESIIFVVMSIVIAITVEVTFIISRRVNREKVDH